MTLPFCRCYSGLNRKRNSLPNSIIRLPETEVYFFAEQVLQDAYREKKKKASYNEAGKPDRSDVIEM